MQVLERLDYLASHHPEARASLSPLTILLMSKGKFSASFPVPPATDATDADATAAAAAAAADTDAEAIGGSAEPDSAATAARLRGGGSDNQHL